MLITGQFAHMISTAATLVPCTGCSAHILACHSGGFRTYTDPESLSINAEIAARITGRPVFDVIGWGCPRRLYLESRTLLRVMGDREYPVVASHQCPSGRTPGNPVTGTELTCPFPMPRKKPKRKAAHHDRSEPIPF
jgi:hypothetical protein